MSRLAPQLVMLDRSESGLLPEATPMSTSRASRPSWQYRALLAGFRFLGSLADGLNTLWRDLESPAQHALLHHDSQGAC